MTGFTPHPLLTSPHFSLLFCSHSQAWQPAKGGACAWLLSDQRVESSPGLMPHQSLSFFLLFTPFMLWAKFSLCVSICVKELLLKNMPDNTGKIRASSEKAPLDILASLPQSHPFCCLNLSLSRQ